MVILITEKASQSLRGELSRWLMEPVSGIFIGKVSALVRDLLWEKCVKSIKAGGCILIYSFPTEQGFIIKSHGRLSKEVVEIEGLFFVRKPKRV